MDKAQRLRALIEHYSGGNNSKFAKKIGITPQGVSSWLIRNTYDIELLYAKCEEVSSRWLLTGEGKMFAGEDYPLKYKEEMRPRIPMDAAAGSLSIAADGITLEKCEQVPLIKAFRSYDFTILARGDSMEPEFQSGDELACIHIKSSSFIQWGRLYVIDTAQGILIKRIFDDGESIICKSDNSGYPDFRIEKTELYNIALVIGMIRRY